MLGTRSEDKLGIFIYSLGWRPRTLTMKRIYCLLPITLVIQAPTQAQTLLHHWQQPDGHVHDIEVDTTNGIAYLGGQFSHVGKSASSIALVEASTGNLIHVPQLLGSANSCAVDGTGGWFIGGSFTEVDGQPRNRLARLLSDGTLSDWSGPTLNGNITKIWVINNNLYIKGYFTSIADQPRNGIASIDISTGTLLDWDPGISGASISTMIASGDTIFVGGSFSSFYGLSRNKCAAFRSSTGSILTWAPSILGSVSSIAVRSNTVFVAGSLSSVNGIARDRIAEINRSNGSLTSWSISMPNNSIVRNILLNNNSLIITGFFSMINGTIRNNIAALDIDSADLLTWNPSFGPTNSSSQLAVHNNAIYLCGSFTTSNEISRLRAANFDATTAEILSWDPAPSGEVLDMAPQGSAVLLCGRFTCINSVTRKNLCAIDLHTGTVTNWEPMADSTVYELVLNDTVIYAGGIFTLINDSQRKAISGISTITSEVTDEFDYLNNYFIRVTSLDVKDSLLFVSGMLMSNNADLNNVIIINLNSNIINDVGANIAGQVYDLKVSNDTVFVSGLFLSINGIERTNSASFNLVTGSVTDWAPVTLSSVLEMFVTDNEVYLSGNFWSVNGMPSNHLAKVDRGTGSLIPWNINVSDDVRAIWVHEGNLFIGGIFETVNMEARSNIAVFNTTTGDLLPWDPEIRSFPPSSPWHEQTVHTITAHDTLLLLGGSFRTIDGTPRCYFAALHYCPSETYYVDDDGDGHGDPLSSITECPPIGPGYVALGDDCDDSLPGAWVGSPCDDGNSITVDDSWSPDCICAGELITSIVPVLGTAGLVVVSNPVEDALVLNMAVEGGVFDLQGKELLRTSRSNFVDVRCIPPGVYLLRTTEGTVLRFVKR